MLFGIIPAPDEPAGSVLMYGLRVKTLKYPEGRVVPHYNNKIYRTRSYYPHTALVQQKMSSLRDRVRYIRIASHLMSLLIWNESNRPELFNFLQQTGQQLHLH
ncbi:hypothetical protein I308_104720 [Cryptococcus tetragattii IND107]|uniref:Uncharacterized protein n=1 Tax=Cryptococcus tetragattii IND107 TaxID=1296105 RepID=A0ABR3BNE3_9TREE